MMTSGSPALDQRRSHGIPAWWRNAKLGIFVHWTIAAVPAFAPAGGAYGDLLASGAPDAFKVSPYVEWYENSLRFEDSPASAYHRATFPDRSYRSFAEDFEAGLASWDPHDWAVQFAATGARYVVLVAKHHDGWCLWPTTIVNPNLPGWHSTRDIVGELAEAVRAEGMRFGLYYSGGLDWTFRDSPMGSMGGVVGAIPRRNYPAYARAQVLELIERYSPDVLWNDIAWPEPKPALFSLFERYYEAVPDGVVNDRWMPWSPLALAARTRLGRRLIDAQIARTATKDGGLVPPKPPHFDVRTPEYTVFDDVQSTPWECVRGMDHSFGYNAQSTPEDFISHDELLWMLTDITSKGGNLLLNVGPRGVDAALPELQRQRLTWLAAHRTAFEVSLADTRPWTASGEDLDGGSQVRYTQRDATVFVHLDKPPVVITLHSLHLDVSGSAASLSGIPVPVVPSDDGVRLDLSGLLASDDVGDGPVVVALHGVTPRHGTRLSTT